MRVCGGLAIVSALLLGVAVLHAQVPRPGALLPDPQSGLIVGQVVDADSGKPIRDAVVSIPSVSADALAMRRGVEPSLFLQTNVLTGPDGRFVFRDLPRGSFGILATKPGYLDGAYGRRRPNGPSQQLSLTEAERVGDVVIRLWKHAAITGTIVDEAGEPLVGIQVVAYQRSLSALVRGISGAGVTDDRGDYRLRTLAAGDYVVVVTSRGAAVPLEQRDGNFSGNSRNVRMLLGTPGAMQVGDMAYELGAGAPVPPPPDGARLFVYPATYYAAVRAASQATIVTVKSGEERGGVDFQLRPVPTVRVSGVLVGPEGEAPPMPLRLYAAEDLAAGMRNELFTVATDGYGRFKFPAIPEGQYVVHGGTATRAPSRPGDTGGSVLWAQLPLSVGREDIDGLVVTLQPGLRISGHFEFEGAQSRPTASMLEMVPISIEPADPGNTFVMPQPVARPTATGSFTTVGMPPGNYFVRVTGSPVGWMFKTATYGGRDIADHPLELNGSDASGVVITFTDRWTGVRGFVTQSSGRVSTDAIVVLFPTESQFWALPNARRIKSARATRTGEYVINSVPVGSYYIVAVPDEQAGDWRDPKFLQMLVSGATQIAIHDGEKRVQNLQLREIR